MIGPGKYDEECTWVREKTEALGVIVLVLGGKKGFGMACQLPIELLASIPAALRTVADEIEADYEKRLQASRNN